jgi:hypothetical protein
MGVMSGGDVAEFVYCFACGISRGRGAAAIEVRSVGLAKYGEGTAPGCGGGGADANVDGLHVCEGTVGVGSYLLLYALAIVFVG